VSASPDAAAAAAFSAAAAGLSAAGLNRRGCLSIDRYDALVPAAWRARELLPAARSALVLAAGGRALFEAFRASPEAARASDPLDAYSRRVAEAAAAAVAGRAVFAFERRGGSFADFVGLARAAGLGAPSRLGLLLHPEFGPWMSIRAVLLTPLALPASAPLADFDPCPGCAAPCAQACRGAALVAGRFDIARCAATRSKELDCRVRCDARRACTVGPRHGYAEAAEAHHMRALPSP
jgi:epoxyqueuosine reductase QueG